MCVPRHWLLATCQPCPWDCADAREGGKGGKKGINEQYLKAGTNRGKLLPGLRAGLCPGGFGWP